MATPISQLQYNLSDFKNNACNPDILAQEFLDASITTVQNIQFVATTVMLHIAGFVTEQQAAAIDVVVKAHAGAPFSRTSQDSNDPTEHVVEVGDWVTVGAFSSGPLPTGKYVTQWSAEAKTDAEAIGNRIEIRLMMWGAAEASNDALGLPAYQQYQAGAWLSLKAGQSFVYEMQARAIGCNGTVRRIRFGMIPASS